MSRKAYRNELNKTSGEGFERATKLRCVDQDGWHSQMERQAGSKPSSHIRLNSNHWGAHL